MGDDAWGSGTLTVSEFGDRAVLVTCSDQHQRSDVAATLRDAFAPHCVRSGLTTVLVEESHPTTDILRRVVAVLEGHPPGTRLRDAPERSISIPLRYDGDDLAECASWLGVSALGLASAHSAQVWQVAMIGFAPGFGYLVPVGDLTADWSVVPRRSSPRARVEPGSVAVAAGMSAVYPGRMPGGWNLIGRTDIVMFDAGNDDRPAVLAEGDLVRFAP